MAGLIGHVKTSAAIASGAGSTKTILRITAPSTHGVRVTRASVSFDGTSPTAGKALVTLIKGATGGTGSSVTPEKIHGHTGSLGVTAKENFSDGSGGVGVFEELIHTQQGYTAPEEILLNPSETLEFQTNIPASTGVRARFRWEE